MALHAVFAGAGVVGALLGAEFAKAIDDHKLLLLSGLLMVVVGLVMFCRQGRTGDASVRLTVDTARELLPLLLSNGFAVGVLSGFFGIGGGFLIVSGLMLATRMPLTSTIGTSLVAVSAFGAATAASYAVSGLIDWTVAALLVLGGVAGGGAGVAFGRLLAPWKRALTLIFATTIVAVGVYVQARSVVTLGSA